MPGTIARRLAVAVRAALLLLLLLGVAPASTGEVLVGAAASLRGPLAEVAHRFEAARPGTRVLLSFGASSTLAAQIEAGAPFDLFLSADPQSCQRLRRAGCLDEAGCVPFAGNSLVVLRSGRFEGPLEGPSDLCGPALARLALPAAPVPLGRYARGWLGRHGVLDCLEGRLVLTSSAGSTLAAVEAGQVDAAVVYGTDALVARSARLAFRVAEAEQPRITYVAALTRRGGSSEPARAFLTHLLGPGLEVVRAAGFQALPPASPGPAGER